jgi:putative oxidoreductase
MKSLFNKLEQRYGQFFGLISYARSPFLLFVRLYWGWQLVQSGWGKFQHLPNVAEYFASLSLPIPAQMAVFIACVEFFGGVFLALGLLSRLTTLVLTVNMIMAYVTADSEALHSIFSDPDKFMAAAPFTFLFASLMILVFGAGTISVDTVLAFFLGATRVKQVDSVPA